MAKRTRRNKKKLKRFKNDFEKKVYNWLKKHGGFQSVEYEAERIPYVIEHTYLPDFKCVDKDGKVWYYESKGRFSSEDRRKMKAVVEQHPEAKFVIIFQANNKLSKKSKMRYLEWCEKNGIEAMVLK